MTLDDILSASELNYVMEDIKNFPTSFIENSALVQQLSLPDVSGSHSMYDSDTSDAKPPSGKRKKLKRMCDSTLNVVANMTEALPCLEPFPGILNFQLQLPTDNAVHKWTYSKILGKVFIDIDKVLALHFRWNYIDHKDNGELYVRAMPVFTAHDSLNIPVTRCPIHLLPDNSYNQGFQFVEHVMRCEHSSTIYEKDPLTQRLSCRTPLNRPQPGSETTTLTYKFVCKTSCIGGMNRKPISVIFTLEDENRVEFGRQQLAVKICSCPKRDKSKEEKNECDKDDTARSLTDGEATPTLRCVRTMSARTDLNTNEPLRDIKNVVCCKNSRESIEAQPGTSIKKNEFDEIMDAIKSLDKKINFQNRHCSVLSNFLKYLEAEMQDMSADEQLEAQSEFQRTICLIKRKRQSVDFLQN